MANPSQPPRAGGTASRPLWVIAFSLVVIAFCLVLLVVSRQLDKAQAEFTVQPPPPDQSAPLLSKREFPKRTFNSSVPPNEASPTPKAGPVEISLAVNGEAGAMVMPVPSRAGGPGGGIIAPLTTAANTNSITAIAGRVTLRGDAPAEAQFYVIDEPHAKSPAAPRTTENFVVSADGGFADVLVAIKGTLNRKSFPPPSAPLELVLANGRIQPHASALMIGQRIFLRNLDHFAHQLKISKPDRAAFMEIPIKADAAFSISDVIKTPNEFLHIRCGVHVWEFGNLSLLEHPYFAITDTNGNFTIPNVPPGKYTLQASHPKIQGTNAVSREIVVQANKITHVDFALNAPKDAPAAPRIQARLAHQ